MKITVCTPAYNRGYIIEKLYDSLKKQSFKDFEWLIIDDGSTDHTDKIVEAFQSEKILDIRYIRKENGGKHTALNVGIDKARGELFWIVDSDDQVTENALDQILKVYNTIEDKQHFAGVAGLRGNSKGQVIGTTTKESSIDADSLAYRYHYHVQGDKAEVFRTELLRHYKFPEFKGEKYVTEAVVWNRIAADGYAIRWFNEIIYICEYLEDGLTFGSDKNIIDSWQGTTLYYKELLGYGKVPFKDKLDTGIRAYLHYCYEKGTGFKGIFNITHKMTYIFCALFIYIGKLLKRNIKSFKREKRQNV